MLWIHLVKGIKDKMDDPNLPVLMDMERRRPGYWRRHYTLNITMVLNACNL